RGGGIRGMGYDAARRGCWVISGLSPHLHGVRNDWKLWFWNLNDPPREAKLDDIQLTNPEAVCPLQLDGKPRLLLIEDLGQSHGFTPYVVLPVPELRKRRGAGHARQGATARSRKLHAEVSGGRRARRRPGLHDRRWRNPRCAPVSALSLPFWRWL